MTTFVYRELSGAGKRSPLIFYNTNTRHSWALWAFLTKTCSGINREEVHSLCGHNLTDKIQSFSLHLHATEVRLHFCEAPFCLLKIVLVPFEPKGSGPSHALSVWDLRDCLCPILPSYANIFSTVLSRSELRVSYQRDFSSQPGQDHQQPLMATVKGFEHHEQILLFLYDVKIGCGEETFASQCNHHIRHLTAEVFSSNHSSIGVE